MQSTNLYFIVPTIRPGLYCTDRVVQNSIVISYVWVKQFSDHPIPGSRDDYKHIIKVHKSTYT